jgi:hypothetical protein
METIGNQDLIDVFLKFGVTALLGFLIGLEREMAGNTNSHAVLIITASGLISSFLYYDFSAGI